MKISDATIRIFRRKLRDFFKKSGREHLPWRRKGISAYEVWVSEVMLQQTQVSRVIGYYTRFLRRFPTIQKLARVSWQEFLPYYEGLGYYARGRNMLTTAKIIGEQYASVFPREIAELQKLPGIGPYTARAIASFAYGAPEIAWDTNVRRVIGRFFFDGKERVKGQEDSLNQAFGKDAPWLNSALMDFGSSLCTARPKCEACMLRLNCVYYATGGRKENKARKTKLVIPKPDYVVLFLHERHQRYFSTTKRGYKPFFLPRTVCSRSAIKAYFRDQYGLKLSVRPPQAVGEFRGKRYTLVNAQILSGGVTFTAFPKKARIEYNKAIRLL